MMNLDHFGKTVAGIKTVQILEGLDDPYLQRKATTQFADFCLGLEQIRLITEKAVFERLLDLWKKDFMERVKTNESYPLPLKTHLTNTMMGMARDFRRHLLLQRNWVRRRQRLKIEEQLCSYRKRFQRARLEAGLKRKGLGV